MHSISQHRHRRNHRHARNRLNARNRRGSMLLLCTLAAVVLSFAAITILRSHTQKISQIEASESAVQSQLTTDGLVHRAIAQLRVDPRTNGKFTDRDSRLPDAYVEVRSLSATATEISVYLYAGSRTPSVVRVIDPTKL